MVEQHFRIGGLLNVIRENGDKEWWLGTKRHRDGDLPAIEYQNGTKHWYVNNMLHRDNGLPAIEYANGTKSWYLSGNKVTEEVNEWLEENKISYPFNEEELVMFKLRWL